MNADKIIDVLNAIAPILYVVVPAGFAVWYNLKKKIDIKKDECIKRDRDKATKLYDIWEHEESKVVIRKIKNQCNFYKDKGHADLVQYLQLENGTSATSKIQNMFVTCLAEDDRYGALPKLISIQQRIPYSECLGWMDKVSELDPEGDEVVVVPNLHEANFDIGNLEQADKVGSVLLTPVYDVNEVLLGMVVFYYHNCDFNGMEEEERNRIVHFRTSIESILTNYHFSRETKKKEYGLEV